MGVKGRNIPADETTHAASSNNCLLTALEQDTIELAISLAGDLPHLAALRARLRERMAAVHICEY